MSQQRHKIADVSDLSEDSFPLIVDVMGVEVGVFNLDGEYFGVANHCPHVGGPLCEGEVTGLFSTGSGGDFEFTRDGEYIACPWHKWKFDIRTGTHVIDEKISVPTFEVKERDGELLVEF